MHATKDHTFSGRSKGSFGGLSAESISRHWVEILSVLIQPFGVADSMVSVILSAKVAEN